MLSYELKDEILQYLEGRIALEDLEDWLVPRLPSFLTFAPSADAQVAGAVELGLAEINDDLITEEQFREYLAETVRKEPTVACRTDPEKHVQTGSVNHTIYTAPVFVSETAVFRVVSWQ